MVKVGVALKRLSFSNFDHETDPEDKRTSFVRGTNIQICQEGFITQRIFCVLDTKL
jgi:hypothetical protein